MLLKWYVKEESQLISAVICAISEQLWSRFFPADQMDFRRFIVLLFSGDLRNQRAIMVKVFSRR
ncbi:hypothetical protein SAMN04488024_10924 [Pedobacter soli]|uniref:Uncharacterized protein n=1 Tax=Pedobacter soli TaxID=390242 RepID=A0A1G6YHE4_9SPHI|nr:hypothetical protein SAMN04488024_10924 [Pedobacter soli]